MSSDDQQKVLSEIYEIAERGKALLKESRELLSALVKVVDPESLGPTTQNGEYYLMDNFVQENYVFRPACVERWQVKVKGH